MKNQQVIGILEEWNFGMLGSNPLFQSSTIPSSSPFSNLYESFEKLLYALLIRDFWAFSEISIFFIDYFALAILH
jgi:hypothetical protein